MSEQGPDEIVTRSVVLPATRADVWAALTTPAELSFWLGEVLELDTRPTGGVIVREPDGAIRRGSVEAVEAGRSLVLRWRRLSGAGATFRAGEATRVTFELDDDPDGTRLTVSEERVPLVTRSAR